MKEFIVNADHVSPNYRFANHLAKAKESPGRPGYWFATADRLGCSKDYTTPEAAVRSLFEANACTRIRLQVVCTCDWDRPDTRLHSTDCPVSVEKLCATQNARVAGEG